MSLALDRHHDLVDLIIARGSLWSPPLIAAFRATPRHLFLDRLWSSRENRWRLVDPAAPTAEDLQIICSDRAVTTRLSAPIEGEPTVALSSSSQPSLMAQMLEDLQLHPGLHFLEIGAGTGYNAALVSHLVGPILSVDVDREVLDDARRHLLRLPDRPVHLVHADGRNGYLPAAPFDRIQVTAATDDLQPAWLEQLRPGGLLQVPLDLSPGLAWLLQGTAEDGSFVGGLTRAAFFMPLRDEGDSGRDRNLSTGTLPGPDRLQAQPPPWVGWQDLRTGGGVEFLASLALLAWLEGLAIGHATAPDGRPAHGVGDLVRGEACWMGPHEWRVSGQGGTRLGLNLWRRWLDLGAPRPAEWRLRAVPLGQRLSPVASARAVCTRQGPRCEQLWELLEPRRRPVLE